MSTSKVASITCWAILLLTMFPVVALAGRQVPAPPPTAPPTPQVVLGVPSSARAGVLHDKQFRDASRKMKIGSGNVQSWGETNAKASNSDSIYGHRLLVGSAPPTCQGKCGTCSPCNPIHVSIGSPHGALTQQEYYPEVWRCKCGNKLFMP
jgi:hypothetical protein